MKRFFAFTLIITLLMTATGCDILTDLGKGLVTDMYGEEAGDAFGQVAEQNKQELEEMGDDAQVLWDALNQLMEDNPNPFFHELRTVLEPAMDDVPEDVQVAIENKLKDTADTIMNASLYTSLPDENGNDTAILANFPNAAPIVLLDDYKIHTKFPDDNRSSENFTVAINGTEVSMGGKQCLAYARYVQYKLYGTHEYLDGNHFRNMLPDLGYSNVPSGTLTPEQLKQIITTAGPGAHLRTNNGGTSNFKHSMIVAEVREDGFTIIHANGQLNADPMVIQQTDYTWESYPDSTYGKRGFDSVKVYAP